MKKSNFIYALFAVAMISCNGGGTQQPTAQVVVPAPAAPDTTMAQPQAAPAAPQVQPQALPEAVTTFVQQHFPGATVVRVETDNEFGGLEYDVTLNDGTEVDFDTSNQWEVVDCKVKAVPAALVPATIANYVKTNFQSLPITKISNKRYGYEVDLSNGVELKFNAKGQFVGMDD